MAITNTKEQDPITNFAECMFPGGIEAQENRGQRELVNSDVLPTDMRYGAREALEKAGVEILDVVDGDQLFTNVRLPGGWNKKPTGHSMWSDLCDDRGRARFSIFYKAAFYDRDAFISPVKRFTAGYDYERYNASGVSVAHVYDCGKPIFSSEEIRGELDYDGKKQLISQAEQWLDENWPDWRDESAYWD